MKKSIAALALALTLVGTLASCGSRDPNANNTTGGAGDQNGVTSGSTGGGASGTAGTVSRRYGGESTYNTYNTYNSNDYFQDGRYTAGPDGRVYDSTASRDLTQDARDIVRGAGEAIGDAGRDIGNAVRDVTGINGSNSITAQ